MITRIARAASLTHGAVSQWRRIPADYLVTVECVTGIPREELRPDLFRPAPTPPKREGKAA